MSIVGAAIGMVWFRTMSRTGSIAENSGWIFSCVRKQAISFINHYHQNTHAHTHIHACAHEIKGRMRVEMMKGEGPNVVTFVLR